MGNPEDIIGSSGQERTEGDEMELAIQLLCTKIKELAIAGKDSAPKYSTEYTHEGISYKAIYFPKVERTEDKGERKEEFTIVKSNFIDLIEPETPKKRLAFGYSMNYVKDSKKGKAQPVVHVQAFPEDMHKLAKDKETDPRYTPLGEMFFHLMLYAKVKSKRIVETPNGIEEVSVKAPMEASLKLINEMTQTLSGIIPLPA